MWFDDLGPPWPKHACFDDEYYGTRLRTTLRDESRKTPNPVFGVVVETEVIEPGTNGRIVVRCSDGKIIDHTFDTERNLTHFVGVLVIVERTDDGTVSLRWIGTPSSSRWRPQPRLSVGARIAFERREYIWDGQRWYRADDYTIAPTGLQQRLNALADEKLRRAAEDVS